MTYDKALDEYILNIVHNNEVFEQSDLQKMLKDRGHEVPQATLSRRLKKLKIAKISGRYRVVDFNQSHLPAVLNVRISEFGLVVLHTHPGYASSLAYFFDQNYINRASKTMNDLGLLGTIAGDDTVLLIIKNKQSLDKVINLIYTDFPYLSNL